MSKEFWFQKSLHRLLVDMHIPDWKEEFLKDFSADNYAEMMKLAKVDTAILYTGNCLGLCFFPTKVGFPHKSLKGRDLVGEVLEACRKREINTQLYLNVWSRAAYEAHPEWRVIMYDGQGTADHYSNRFGICCPNTGFGKYFLELLGELADRYETCGYWIDMIGNYTYCLCPACQERFRKETSYDSLPGKVDWNDPCFLTFMECRSRWLGEFAKAIYDTVKKKYKERTVTLQTASIGHGCASGLKEDFFQSSDFLAGDFTGGSTEQSSICKLFHALSKYRPIEFMTPRCETLNHHTTPRSYDSLFMRSYAAIANQASFTLIDAIDPYGTLDRRFYEKAAGINSSYARYAKYISGSTELKMDVGIFWSLESLIDPFSTQTVEDASNKPPWHFNDTRQLLAGLLQSEHLLFGFVKGKSPEELAKVPLIILNNTSSLTNKECALLEEYVCNGGCLYASGTSSLFDPEKGMRSDFALAKVFGVHTKGERSRKIAYIAPAFEDALPGVTREYPLMLNEEVMLVERDPDTLLMGDLMLSISTPEERFQFGSAISNPPMISTEHPVLVRHKYGRGEVIYCAGELEKLPFDFHKKVFGGLLKSLLRNNIVETNAPNFVECTLFDDPEKNRYLFSCLNLPKDLPPMPIPDLYFHVRLPGDKKVKRVLLAPEEKPIPFTQEDGLIKLENIQLSEFALFLLEY